MKEPSAYMIAIVDLLRNRWINFIAIATMWGLFFGLTSHSLVWGVVTGITIASLQKLTQYSLSKVKVSK